MEDGTKPKGRCFQKSTSIRKANFKAPASGLEDKVFDFRKQKHAAEFVKKCEVIFNFVAVKYKHTGPKMAISIKNMESPTIKTP